MPTWDSSNSEAIHSFLRDRGIDFISDIKGDRPPPVDFALFISEDRIGEHVLKDATSQRQMQSLQREIKKQLGFEVEWITIPSEKTAKLEAALFELLKDRYPGTISSVLISSLNKPPVSVWVEPKSRDGSAQLLIEVETPIKDFLRLYGIDNPAITHPDSKDIPGKPTILRSVKVQAPITTEQLTEVLKTAGFQVPSIRWLQSKLDSLRKQGFLIRSQTGEYALTELGLQVVPHGKYRASSDVERALAFGKREW